MTVRDQMDRAVTIPKLPNRIVSLVPSITEFLIAIGLADQLVGVTKFCIHPSEIVTKKKRIGGTKNLNLDGIRALQPDLIIGNKEENVKEQISLLESEFPVWMSDCNTFDEGIDMMRLIGILTNKEKEATELIYAIGKSFDNLNVGRNRTFLYLIWNDPMYVVGKGTYISSVLEKIGFINACCGDRYPEWSGEEADIVWLSTEPFPFKESHIQIFQSRFPKSKVQLIDGEMCSWYGSRMLKAAEYFRYL